MREEATLLRQMLVVVLIISESKTRTQRQLSQEIVKPFQFRKIEICPLPENS
jgi:hypothetical protein